MEDDGGSHRNGEYSSTVQCSNKKPRLESFINERQIRDEFAHHQLGVARLNNGSFGSCPESVLKAQREWQLQFLRQPDDFYFNALRDGILRSRTMVKEFINADHVEEVSLVDNATTGAAIVLHHVGRGFLEGRYVKGESIILFHCAYQAVKKSIYAYLTRAGGSVVEVRLPYPVKSKDEILTEFRKGLERGRLRSERIRLAIIDHITSMPSVVLPVRELVEMCREKGVDQVFVDAAHAIGSIEVDMKDIGADFYVSNLHKWFFCPPSAAFLYCKKSNSNSDPGIGSYLHHPVVSHEYGNGLPIESSWIGTRDYSPQLVIPTAFEFVEQFEGGIKGIMKKNHDTVVSMAKMLAEAWGTILGTPEDMCAGMAMVGLPSMLCVHSENDAQTLRSYLRSVYNVEVPIYYNDLRDGEETAMDKDGAITGYARISHQVYNTLEDYCMLRNAINSLVQKRLICSELVKEKKDTIQ